MAIQETELKPKPKTLRIKVVDGSREGKPVVNVKMPIGVVKLGMQMAKAFAPQTKNELDWDAINALVDSGQVGKLVEVEDEAEHKTVEVWVE